MKNTLLSILILTLLVFFPSILLAETLVDVKIPAGTNLETISQKYLRQPGDIKELPKYNKGLPPDFKSPLKTDSLKIPANILKPKAGDLTYVTPLTLSKPKKQLIWQKTEKGRRLFPGDGIMTAAKGTAKISFLAGGDLTVAPNSLIYLKETQERPVTNFLAGNLSVDDARIVSHGVKIRPEKNSRYNINTSASKDLRLSVHQGSVDVTAKHKTVKVKEGFKTQVDFGKEPQAPTPMPEGVSDFTKLRDLKKGEKYHLQIALDKEFSKIVLDKYLFSRSAVKDARTSLEPGGYYLRISLFTKDGFESKWSDFYYFVKGPESGNKLQINNIVKTGKDELQVSGLYPGVTGVFINGHPGQVYKSGKFVCSFKIGTNKMFSIFIQSNSGPFVKRFKLGSSGAWIPIENK